jgi:hypothetical protein
MNNKAKLLASIATVIALCVCLAPWAVPQTSSVGETKAVVDATAAFLNSLSADQRQKVQFPFNPQTTATVARFARGGGPVGGPGGAGGGPGGPGTPDKQFGRGPGDGRGRGPGGGPGGGFTGEQFGQAVWSNFPVSDVPRPA